MTLTSRLTVIPVKHLANAALVLLLGLPGVYAQPKPVNMTVSGTAAPSTFNLLPGAPASEYNLGGKGTLGPFTLRAVSASATSPQQSNTCPSPKLYVPVVAGGGVFRFQDGSLLKLHLTGGSDCIDLAAQQALCTRVFQVTGGTGRFLSASGALTLTETVVPLLGDASNHPVFFTATGGVTGTVSGVAKEQDEE